MKKFLAMMCVAGFACAANANVIYDEAIDGDTADETNPPVLGSLALGDSTVRGDIGGADRNDSYQITIDAGTIWSAFILTEAFIAPGNASYGIVIFDGPDSSFPFLAGAGFSTVGEDVFGVWGIGPLGPGTYTVGLREFGGTVGNLWGLTMTVTPAPASLALLGLGGLVATRRRR